MALLCDDLLDLGGGDDLVDLGGGGNLFNLGDLPEITSDGGGATASINAEEHQTAVTTVVATGDPAPTFSIVGGVDAAKFSIHMTTGVLTFAVEPDFEAPGDADANNQYVVMVSATNVSGSDTQTITVTVTDVAEAPTWIRISRSSVPNGTDTTGGHVVGLLSTEDPDIGDTFTYTITGGADELLFSLNDNELVLDDGVLDADTKNEYAVLIRSTDSGMLFFDREFSIRVSDGGPPLGSLYAAIYQPLAIAGGSDDYYEDGE